MCLIDVLCEVTKLKFINFRSSSPEVFLGKGVLKLYRKFTGEHPCRRVIQLTCFATLLKSYFGMGVLL